MSVVAKCLYKLQEAIVVDFANKVIPNLLDQNKFNKVIATTGSDPAECLKRLQETSTPGAPKLPFIAISRQSMNPSAQFKNNKLMMEQVNGVQVYTREVELVYTVLYCDTAFRDVDNFSEFCVLMLEGFHTFEYLVEVAGKPVELTAQYSIVPTDKPEYFGDKKEYAFTSLTLNVVTTITTGRIVDSVLGTISPVFVE